MKKTETNMNSVKQIAVVCIVGLVTLLFTFTVKAQDKVAYHVDNAQLQATKMLRNVRNHLDVAPDTKITVVAHADGVDFLMEGAKDEKNPNVDYAALVSALKARGVKFMICEITLKNRNLKRDQFILDADYTPSGVALLGQLQVREKFAYIKP
jgi:uncharacterized protein